MTHKKRGMKERKKK